MIIDELLKICFGRVLEPFFPPPPPPQKKKKNPALLCSSALGSPLLKPKSNRTVLAALKKVKWTKVILKK